MSLIKKQSMTEKNRAAHQRNGRQTHGPATAEGKERSRAAHLRHGYYSEERDEALRALGEDPAELAALQQAVQAEWRPTSEMQERMTDRMARLWWRMERAERMQESLGARRMQQLAARRKHVALELRFKTADPMGILYLLVEGASDGRFYTPSGYFEMFSKAFGEELDDTRKEILELMHRLRKPASEAGTNGAGPGQTPPAAPQGPADDPYREFDGIAFAVPWPHLAVAEGAEREELREDLRRLAKKELESEHAVWDPQIENHERPLSRMELDELQAAPHPHAELMRREEESCFRQFMRLGSLLHKRQEREEKRARNEGSPGYVDENTGRGKTEETISDPEPVAASVPKAQPAAVGAAPGVVRPQSGVRSPRSGVRNPESGVRSPRSEVAETESGVENPGFVTEGQRLTPEMPWK